MPFQRDVIRRMRNPVDPNRHRFDAVTMFKLIVGLALLPSALATLRGILLRLLLGIFLIWYLLIHVLGPGGTAVVIGVAVAVWFGARHRQEPYGARGEFDRPQDGL